MTSEGPIISAGDCFLIGYIYRCPDCNDLLEFEQIGGSSNSPSEQHPGYFICYTCNEEGKKVDQNKMSFCQKSFLKALDNLPKSMRVQLFMTHWSEVNR